MKNKAFSQLTKYWTTEYSLWSIWLFGRSYTLHAKRVLGVGFRQAIFVLQGKYATVYRDDREQENFSFASAKKIITQKHFLKNVQKKIKSLEKNFEEIFTASFSDVLTKKMVLQLMQLQLEFLPYYLCILWAPNALPQMNIAKAKKQAIFSYCERERKRLEPFYPKLEIFLQKIFKAIAKKENIDPFLLRFATPDEFVKYFSKKKLPAKNELLKRSTLLVVYAKENKNLLLIGKAAQGKIRSLTDPMTARAHAVRGIAAYKGIARGSIFVVTTETDAKKVARGNILVATMTRPEWVPAMKKAAAFVTDGGGILCHAAIVAREMKKPCIIGTKIATQVFKNGDKVEVDANKGIIRKL